MRPKRPQGGASGLQYLRYCRPDEEPGGSTSSYKVAACADVTVPSTTEGGAALMRWTLEQHKAKPCAGVTVPSTT